MNKQELFEAVQARVKPGDFPSKAAGNRIINAMTDVIKETVAAGEPVSIVGFGTFKRTLRAARDARNPLTDEKIRVEAHNVPVFKAGDDFKKLVKGE